MLITCAAYWDVGGCFLLMVSFCSLNDQYETRPRGWQVQKKKQRKAIKRTSCSSQESRVRDPLKRQRAQTSEKRVRKLRPITDRVKAHRHRHSVKTVIVYFPFSLYPFQLFINPTEGPLSFCFLRFTPAHPQLAVHMGGVRKWARERERTVWMCGILGQTLQPLHLFLLFCLNHCRWKRAITYCKRRIHSSQARRKGEKERKCVSERKKERTKATAGQRKQTDSLFCFKRKERKRKALEYLFFSFVLFFSFFLSWCWEAHHPFICSLSPSFASWSISPSIWCIILSIYDKTGEKRKKGQVFFFFFTLACV